nr:MAG TPA: Poxvirus virion envelope protein A14 [Caudoviricetes sp.]
MKNKTKYDKINNNLDDIITIIVIVNFVSGGIIFPIITFLGWNNKYPYNVISIGIIVLFMVTLLGIFVYGMYIENLNRKQKEEAYGKK